MAVAYCSHASLLFVLLLVSVSTATATAIGLDGGRRKPPAAAPITPPPPPGLGVFDYYILAIQWPISFCSDVKPMPGNECKGTSLPILPETFTVHGLWPSKSVGKPVRSGEPFDVSQIASLAKMKDFWPSAKNFEKTPTVLTYKDFWAHQWQKHGAESGLKQKDYFSLAVQLYEKAKIVFEPYFARRPGSNIDVAAMQAAFSSLGVPGAVCNEGSNGEQLVELHFNISKLGVFQNYMGTVGSNKVCPSVVFLPAN